MLRIIAVISALAVGGTVVWAQNAAGIAARKETMKAFGGAAKAPGGMVKGDQSFELPKVQASLKTIQELAAKAKGVFGDDTKTGETDALPKAFESKADLFARFDKIGADAKAAEGAIKDEATFKVEWPKVASNCGGCHKEYRRPKQ
jgi:cytochrome c556